MTEKLPMKKAILVYGGLSAAANVYANALNSERGKELADEYTWASVDIGVGLAAAGFAV